MTMEVQDMLGYILLDANPNEFRRCYLTQLPLSPRRCFIVQIPNQIPVHHSSGYAA